MLIAVDQRGIARLGPLDEGTRGFTRFVGTLKSVAMRYVFRYLAKFQYRFNRRFKLPELLNRLASVATRAAPRPYKTLKILHGAG